MVAGQRGSSRQLQDEPLDGQRRLRSMRLPQSRQVPTKRGRILLAPEPNHGNHTQSKIAIPSPNSTQALDMNNNTGRKRGGADKEVEEPAPVLKIMDGNEIQSEIILASPKVTEANFPRGVKRKRDDVASRRMPVVVDSVAEDAVIGKESRIANSVPKDVHICAKKSLPTPPTAISGRLRTRRGRQIPYQSGEEGDTEVPTDNIKPELIAKRKNVRTKRASEKQRSLVDNISLEERQDTPNAEISSPNLPDTEKAHATAQPVQQDLNSAISDPGGGPSTPPPPRIARRRILGSGSIRKWISYVRYPSPDSIHSSDIGSGQESSEDDTKSGRETPVVAVGTGGPSARLQPQAQRGGLFNFQVSPIKFGSRISRATKSLQRRPAWRNLDAG